MSGLEKSLQREIVDFMEILSVEMRKNQLGLCEKYICKLVEKYYVKGDAGSGNVCAVGVFVTAMDSWMCQQPTWTTTKNFGQTIYTPPKTTLTSK